MKKILMLFVALFMFGCASNYYQQDKSPTLRYRSKAELSNGQNDMYFTISNPTDRDMNFVVWCSSINGKFSLDKHVFVKAKSDEMFSIGVSTTKAGWTCRLLNADRADV